MSDATYDEMRVRLVDCQHAMHGVEQDEKGVSVMLIAGIVLGVLAFICLVMTGYAYKSQPPVASTPKIVPEQHRQSDPPNFGEHQAQPSIGGDGGS
jgi:hypothetical protein